MFAFIIALITGLAGPLSALAGRLFDLKIAQVNAKTDVDKAAINEQIEEVHDKRAVLIAESGNRLASFLNATMRFAIAIGPAAYIIKIFAWDKVIGAIRGCVGDAGNTPACMIFNTDRLDPYLWGVVMAIIGFYFVTTTNWFKK